MTRLQIRMGAAIFTAALAWSPAAADDGIIPAPVQASVRAAVEDGGRIGVIIGYMRDGRSEFYAHGSTAVGGGVPINPDTIFEVGSVTKVFTAEALAALTLTGDVAMDTTLAQIWPDIRYGREITLGDLATHRAGLPREIPSQALAKNDEAALLTVLAQAPLTSEAAYSNAGMAILARAMAARTGQSPAWLIKRLVAGPMGLVSTGYEPVDASRLAHPHIGSADIGENRPETVEIAQGAGGLHSTARDLLDFLAQHLDHRAGRSGEMIDLSLSGADGVPLGWQVHQQGARRIFHHSGEADGYQAFVGFHDANGGVAVVLLTNSSQQDALQEIALHLLDDAMPLPTFELVPAGEARPALANLAGAYVVEGQEDANRIAFVDLGNELGYLETGPDGGVIRRARLEEIAPSEFRLRGTPIRIVFEAGGRARLIVGEQTFRLLRQD